MVTIVLLAGFLGGCATDLRTGEVNRPTESTQLQAGFFYNLPAAVVTPSGSIRVAGKQILIDNRELSDFLKTSSNSLKRHPIAIRSTDIRF